jgi:hypothetical protein
MTKDEMVCRTCIYGSSSQDQAGKIQVDCRRKADLEASNQPDFWCGEGEWREEYINIHGEPQCSFTRWGQWDPAPITPEEKEEARKEYAQTC